jgi:tetratricopeptide (TPR) repeat protein
MGLFLTSWPNRAIAETEPDPQPQFSEMADSEGDFSQARKLMKEKKWVEAVVVLRSQLKDPGHPPSTELDLARALVYSGRREEAMTVLGQILARKKGNAKKDLIRRERVFSRIFLTNAAFQTHQDGLNFLLAGKYRQAREKFEKALEQDPANVEVLTRLSQCLVLSGDYDSAAERLRLARRLNPFEPEVRLWLGWALKERGELRDALMELKSSYQELPSSETAAVWYAEALFDVGQKPAALQILDDDVSRHPGHVWSLLTASRFRSLDATSEDAGASSWRIRKDLQLAQSRLPLYESNALESASLLNERPIDSMGDLAFEVHPSETELKKDIQKLMEETDSRIESASSLNSK